MYIRVTSTPKSPRKSVKVVESIREGFKVKQVMIHHVGIAADEKEIEKLKQLGLAFIANEQLKREKASNQSSLFDSESAAQRLKDIEKSTPKPSLKQGRKPNLTIRDVTQQDLISLADLVEEKRVVEGIHEVAGHVYEQMGYDQLLPREKDRDLLKDLVLMRLANPGSKLKAQQILQDRFAKAHDLNAIYRLMDKLYPKIGELKSTTFRRTQQLIPRAIDILFFDCTTLYFEPVETDELRQFGYSKDHRFNTTQLVLALATTGDGLPIGYELFEGNKAEVKTLLDCLSSWKSMFNIASVCFVADRGMMSDENLKALEEQECQYVVAAKLRGLPEELKSEILLEKNYQPQSFIDHLGWVGEFKYTQGENRIEIAFEELKQELKEETLYVQVYRDEGNPILKFKIHNHLEQPKYLDEVQSGELKRIIHEYEPDFLTGKSKKRIKVTRTGKKAQIFLKMIPLCSLAASRRLVVSYKTDRARRDGHQRHQIIEKIKKRLGFEGDTQKLITNQGVKKYTKSDQSQTVLDTEKINNDAQWDGLHGVVTNIQSDQESGVTILMRYTRLWKIEESFRLNKHTLSMRPIYHFKPERIKAHIALCYMAFSVLRHMEYVVKITQKISPETMIDELFHVQSSIHRHTPTQKLYRLPGKFSQQASKIYKAFQINRVNHAQEII